ncbi:MAG: PLDc N-terminal domain-containing protein, partial [Novipirellula sp. JB048]
MSELLDELWHSWSVVVPVIVAVLELSGLVSAWHAINKVRTSQAAVAWAVGLVTLPILVLPLYWIFGRNKFAGYREAIRLVEQQHQDSAEAARRELVTDNQAGDPTVRSPLGHLADILDTPLSYGNQFQLLVDGGPFFDTLLEQIASAERYIYAQFCIGLIRIEQHHLPLAGTGQFRHQAVGDALHITIELTVVADVFLLL